MTTDAVFIYDRDMTNPDGFSASDWQLFAGMADADLAAVELTDAVFAALRASNRADAEVIARAALEKWQHVGAYDTEPRNLMMSYLNAAFGIERAEALTCSERASLDAALDTMFAGLDLAGSRSQ